MSKLVSMLLLGGYSFLILPAIIVFGAALIDRSQNPEQPSRKRLLVYLSLSALLLAVLGLLIWFNPYGSEINSSLPAYGVLIVLAPIMAYLLYHARELASLWPWDRVLAIIFVLVFLALFLLLWFADPIAFTMLIVLALGIALAWNLPRGGAASLGILSLLILVTIVLTTGGWIYIPSADLPEWSRMVLSVFTVSAILLSILLPAGLLYASLRSSSPIKKPHLLWSLVFIAILLAGMAYQVAWDGIWSSAHARAFEDHLPFIQSMLSLAAGIFLTLTLRGWRRLVGPLYFVLVTSVAVVALSQGWKLSAFEMTERRAAVVDGAVESYYQENGVYPGSLAELSPRYLPLVLPPVVVRTGGWCYQSGEDFYRLGYISGDFTYFDSEFRVETYAQAGDIPAGDWACDEWRARFQAKELTY